MKKMWMLFLVLSLLLTLCACGDKSDKGGNDDPNLVKIGDYEAVYKGSEIVKDADDADAIVITYDYTNKSDAAQSFQWAFYYDVFQDGIGLDFAVVWVSEDSYDTLDEALSTEVQPGSTLEVKMTYKLRNLTSPVELEFSDLFDEHTDKLTIDLSTAKLNNTPAETETTEAPTEGTDTTEATENTEEPTEAEVAGTDSGSADWWLGDWYGTWTLVSATGESYASYAGTTWDCCGFIEEEDGGTYLLSLWDEDFNDYTKNCLAEVSLEFTTEQAYSDRGAMISNDAADNYFWDSTPSYGSWYLDPGLLDYKDTFTIYGTHEDETTGESFEYMVTMCKWGSEWDDNAGQRPTYYDSYFLPLMDAGEALPATFTPSEG